jgi:hypothetical protein
VSNLLNSFMPTLPYPGVPYRGKHERREGESMNEVIGDLDKLITDLTAAYARLMSDGKVTEATVLKLLLAQFNTVLHEVEDLAASL